MKNRNIILKNKTKISSMDNKNIPKINWVSDYKEVRILMPDGSWTSGLGESAISKLKVGQLIQFERFGFVRFDRKIKRTYEFWFSHK